MSKYLRLGINIDHVATIRNARGGHHPDPVAAAHVAVRAGADGITAHLREDRRHISDEDIARLKEELAKPLNLEMAATGEMMEIALHHQPHACCIVPEKRQELTTEGGLDVLAAKDLLMDYTSELNNSMIRTSLFIDPQKEQAEAAKEVGAKVVEFHTGSYCEAVNKGDVAIAEKELARLQVAVEHADNIGLEVHAGHGLGFTSVGDIAAMKQVVELNIGHFLVGEAIFGGLGNAVRQMRELMDVAREFK
jgi:pyridoxine 5-phosphate synthase